MSFHSYLQHNIIMYDSCLVAVLTGKTCKVNDDVQGSNETLKLNNSLRKCAKNHFLSLLEFNSVKRKFFLSLTNVFQCFKFFRILVRNTLNTHIKLSFVVGDVVNKLRYKKRVIQIHKFMASPTLQFMPSVFSLYLPHHSADLVFVVVTTMKIWVNPIMPFYERVNESAVYSKAEKFQFTFSSHRHRTRVFRLRRCFILFISVKCLVYNCFPKAFYFHESKWSFFFALFHLKSNYANIYFRYSKEKTKSIRDDKCSKFV